MPYSQSLGPWLDRESQLANEISLLSVVMYKGTSIANKETAEQKVLWLLHYPQKLDKKLLGGGKLCIDYTVYQRSWLSSVFMSRVIAAGLLGSNCIFVPGMFGAGCLVIAPMASGPCQTTSLRQHLKRLSYLKCLRNHYLAHRSP